MKEIKAAFHISSLKSIAILRLVSKKYCHSALGKLNINRKNIDQSELNM